MLILQQSHLLIILNIVIFLHYSKLIWFKLEQQKEWFSCCYGDNGAHFFPHTSSGRKRLPKRLLMFSVERAQRVGSVRHRANICRLGSCSRRSRKWKQVFFSKLKDGSTVCPDDGVSWVTSGNINDLKVMKIHPRAANWWINMCWALSERG